MVMYHETSNVCEITLISCKKSMKVWFLGVFFMGGLTGQGGWTTCRHYDRPQRIKINLLPRCILKGNEFLIEPLQRYFEIRSEVFALEICYRNSVGLGIRPLHIQNLVHKFKRALSMITTHFNCYFITIEMRMVADEIVAEKNTDKSWITFCCSITPFWPLVPTPKKNLITFAKYSVMPCNFKYIKHTIIPNMANQQLFKIGTLWFDVSEKNAEIV